MNINNHERTNSAARFTNCTSKTLCEATRVHSATANVITRKLSSFSPTLCHININDEDRDSDNYEGWNFNSGNYLFTTDTK